MNTLGMYDTKTSFTGDSADAATSRNILCCLFSAPSLEKLPVLSELLLSGVSGDSAMERKLFDTDNTPDAEKLPVPNETLRILSTGSVVASSDECIAAKDLDLDFLLLFFFWIDITERDDFIFFTNPIL